MERKLTSNQFELLAILLWSLAVIAAFVVLSSGGQLGLLAGLFIFGIMVTLPATAAPSPCFARS